MRRFLFLIICIQQSVQLVAQGTNQGNDPVHKEYQQTLFQMSGRVDVVIDTPNVTFYVESLYNTNGVYASITEQIRWNIKPGFDWGITDKWHVGVSERINGNNGGIYNYITRFYIQHR